MRWVYACLLMLLVLRGGAADYHVNSRTGDDANEGTAPGAPWRSLDRVNRQEFGPGDRVLLHRGSAWRGQLKMQARGRAGAPVMVRAYGEGAMPKIDASGLFEDALLLINPQYFEVQGLELTNTGTNEAPRRGVHLLADNAGSLSNVVVRGLYVHDVRGTQKRKDNGGIIFRTRGDKTPTRFVGLRIEHNIIWKVDRSGIAADSYHARRTRWFPSLDVVIRDNWVGDVGGDGIVPWATEGVLVEHNIVQGANERAGSYNAGIWPWSTDNTVMRLNRASEVKTLMDGQGFDADYNSRNTLIEYNLSHDNEGGFLLICSPGDRNPQENLGNQGTIARYNISRNDAARTFHLSAVEQTLIHNNAIYTAPGSDVQLMLFTDWSGWAKGLVVSNNLFYSGGIARYGHQVSRSEKGGYGIGPGWGPARDIVFAGNRYLGEHVDAPQEETPTANAAPKPVQFDWPGPQFDPTRPESFSDYIREHRRWMLGIMEHQFGSRPVIALDSEGLSRGFPGDTGITNHPQVLFHEDFEGADFSKWDLSRKPSAPRVVLATTPGEAHAGRQCVQFTVPPGKEVGTGLVKWFPGEDKLHVRFYLRFADDYDQGNLHHTGVKLAAETNRWHLGVAGQKPNGTDFFITGLEPWRDYKRNSAPGEWLFYTYYPEMKRDRDGHFWGNFFKPDNKVLAKRGQWCCYEIMVKANRPGEADGEQAFWIDGELQGHFTGIRWRTVESLKLNGVWLTMYIHDNPQTNRVWFDDVVVAREYIGPRR